MSAPVFSGFELPEDIRLMRDAVSRFVREEIIPAERALPPEGLRRLFPTLGHARGKPLRDTGRAA